MILLLNTIPNTTLEQVMSRTKEYIVVKEYKYLHEAVKEWQINGRLVKEYLEEGYCCFHINESEFMYLLNTETKRPLSMSVRRIIRDYKLGKVIQ